MSKKILVVYFSQSGQLKEIADSILDPFKGSDEYVVKYHEIKMEEEYPFPWSSEAFFGAFPDSFLQHPRALKPVPLDILNEDYDLILLHYQVWYLSPSVPFNSFLLSKEGKHLLQGKPVITINGSRNMWILAQEKVKKTLKSIGANLVGNIALVDRASNLVSVVTIVQWMFSGKKQRYLGVFPKPGVSDEDIYNASKFGEIIKSHLDKDNYNSLQNELVDKGAVVIKSFLLSVDQKGNAIFKKWAGFIDKKQGDKSFLLKLFKTYLLIALFIVSPIVFVFHLITYPFWRNSFLKEREYYQGV